MSASEQSVRKPLCPLSARTRSFSSWSGYASKGNLAPPKLSFASDSCWPKATVREFELSTTSRISLVHIDRLIVAIDGRF